MLAYITRRLLIAIPLLLVVSFVVFMLSRVGGRDPVDAILGEKGSPEARERVTRELGLDRPLIVQYGIYIKGVLRGNFGKSYIMRGQSVSEQILRRLPPTIELSLAAMLIAIVLGIPAGVAAAVWKSTWVDYVSMTVSLLGVSVPVFWLGLLLILAAGDALPTGGNIDAILGEDIEPKTHFMLLDAAMTGGEYFKDALLHLLLPALTLATIPLAMTARITRAAMLEVLGNDYVRTARAKGVSGYRVVMRHAFRNALIPVVTLLGLEFGYLLGGAVLTETVFDWPGMGTYIVNAVFQTDPVSICGASLVITTTFIVVNLAVDVAYAFIDPRIRHA